MELVPGIFDRPASFYDPTGVGRPGAVCRRRTPDVPPSPRLWRDERLLQGLRPSFFPSVGAEVTRLRRSKRLLQQPMVGLLSRLLDLILLSPGENTQVLRHPTGPVNDSVGDSIRLGESEVEGERVLR